VTLCRPSETQILRDALRRIVAIEDKMVGGDWEEIEEARQIARDALARSAFTAATDTSSAPTSGQP
jgi:hypothetical protein